MNRLNQTDKYQVRFSLGMFRYFRVITYCLTEFSAKLSAGLRSYSLASFFLYAFGFALFGSAKLQAAEPSVDINFQQGDRAAHRYQAKKIVVSLQPYALLLEHLKLEQDHVDVLLSPGLNPHNFQLRASHLKKIAEADLIIWGGPQIEPLLARALAEKPKQLVLMDLEGIELATSDSSHHDHDHDADSPEQNKSHEQSNSPELNNSHEQSDSLEHNNSLELSNGLEFKNLDQHIWFSAKNVTVIAKAMSAALIELQEKNGSKNNHADNGTLLKKNLDHFIDAFSQASLPKFSHPKNKALRKDETMVTTALMVYHDAYTFLEQNLGVRKEFVIRTSHNTQVSLHHWKAFITKLKAYKQQQKKLCIVSSPAYQKSAEQKQVQRFLFSNAMSEHTQIIDIDPLARSKTYEHFLDFWQDSRTRLLNCLNANDDTRQAPID